MLIDILFLNLAFHLSDGNTIDSRKQEGTVSSRLGSCVPNTQFRVNGRLCFCNGLGQWSEATCETIRRQTCKPGQIIWEDCSQCICQEDGHQLCTNTTCMKPIARSRSTNDIDITHVWCMPFVSYYVNCSLCVCPASGKMLEARCAKDASCPFKGASADMQIALQKKVCIPKVMYLFPCFQCHCADDGFFSVVKCVETCHTPNKLDGTRRCIPNTFYREDCNICPCPENGLVDSTRCTKAECNNRFQLLPLDSLRNVTTRCHRHTFASPKCYYCECNHRGQVDENLCFESECISTIKYDSAKHTCSPGEMVPICTQCFCLRNGLTTSKYCTKVCSHQHKLMILEAVIKESILNHRVIDKGIIRKAEMNRICEPDSIYLDEGKFCLCPDIGVTNFKLCISDETLRLKNIESKPVIAGIDFNTPCDPSTFVEFDCNTCYCLNTGKLDPKWCTYDDCEEKKITKDSYKKNAYSDTDMKNGTCIPGSISNKDCNFCICDDNGLLEDRLCTNNSCDKVEPSVSSLEKFTCEPLAYFSIDCNICFCPNNGLKNVAQCTTTICERNFLRSDNCLPGDLFSEECKVCICPPNGDKSNKVCTKSKCRESDTPWRKISQTLLSEPTPEASTRSLELCFPGEEFEVGCKVCVCPDMGLRVFADCTPMLCDDEKNKETSDVEDHKGTDRIQRVKRHNSDDDAPAKRIKENCRSFNVSNTPERRECTPGSMYVIRCQQCICPYMGNKDWFCRPMPAGTYCEQAFPGINYITDGRRNFNVTTNATTTNKTLTEEISRPSHNHTFFSCDKPGRVTDNCFICECQNNYIIEEHCFRNDAKHCQKTRPTFLNKDKLFSN